MGKNFDESTRLLDKELEPSDDTAIISGKYPP